MISIVILTANRRDRLEQTLRALFEQRGAPEWEALIVDNASSDGTAEWLEAGRQALAAGGAGSVASYPRVRFIRLEPSRQLAEARNAGVAAAKGEVVVFLDDDCVPAPDWLAALTAPLAAGFDAVGGLVLPAPDLKFPRWWDQRMNWLVGLTPPREPDDEEGARVYPSTSNLAVRRAALEQIPFQEIAGADWGPDRVYYFVREDSEAWRHWRLAGWRTTWAPGAVVYHHFPQDRLRWDYLCRRATQEGGAAWRRCPHRLHLNKAFFDVFDGPRAALVEIIRAIEARQEGSGRSGSSPAGRSGAQGPWPENPLHAGAYPLLWAWRQLGMIREAAAAGQAGGSGAPEGESSGGNLNVWGAGVRAAAGYAGAHLKRCVRRPLAFLMRGLRSTPPSSAPVEGVGVVCCGFLGDAVLIAPLARALRRRFPALGLHLITLPNGSALYGPAENRFFDSIVTIPHRGRRLSASRVRDVFSSRGINLVVFTYCHLDDPQALLLQGARTVGWDEDVGFPRRLHYELLDRRVKKRMDRPEMENLAALLRAVGGHGALTPVSFTIPGVARARALALLAEAGLEPGRFVCLHPGAGYAAKQWTPDGWAAVARGAAEELSVSAVFVGGEDMRPEVESWVRGHALPAVNFCGRTDIWTMGALLAESAGLITTDSGPKHLAMALGVPTVTLYGASDEKRWGAWRDPHRHRAVRAFWNHLTGEEKIGAPENVEMRAIGPESVLQAAAEVFFGAPE
ncbi:MAG: hypothetical protein Kow0059_16400 [Candidatus Sumerlaeia bacterium]